MPTIFIVFGFIFKFYSDDHEPVHVHVEKDGHEAKYNLEPEVAQVLRTRSRMQHFIDKVWVDDTRVYARTQDGLVANYRFADWKRLREATQQQRADFYLTYSGIHWPQIDEDLSFEGMFASAGLCGRSMTEDTFCYTD